MSKNFYIIINFIVTPKTKNALEKIAFNIGLINNATNKINSQSGPLKPEVKQFHDKLLSILAAYQTVVTNYPSNKNKK